MVYKDTWREEKPSANEITWGISCNLIFPADDRSETELGTSVKVNLPASTSATYEHCDRYDVYTSLHNSN